MSSWSWHPEEHSDLLRHPRATPGRIFTAVGQRAKPLLAQDSLLVDQESGRQRAHAIALRHIAVLVEQNRQPESELLSECIDRWCVFLQVNRVQDESVALQTIS